MNITVIYVGGAKDGYISELEDIIVVKLGEA